MENNVISEHGQNIVEEVTIEDLTEVSGAGTLGTASTAGCPASSAGTFGSH
ncbi:thiocillin family RiPP [Streptomyces sp. NPDC088253]|uniref:thiocillin family RiPP n=1 Tax=unclassified Streptomyces TaxID=2593676 RepID=UPI0038160B59